MLVVPQWRDEADHLANPELAALCDDHLSSAVPSAGDGVLTNPRRHRTI